MAVLHEALSNVARHAGAGSVDVDVTMGGDRITIDVRDDGRGMGAATRRSGLANLRRRAERHDGSLTITGRQPTGTQLRWEALGCGSITDGTNCPTRRPHRSASWWYLPHSRLTFVAGDLGGSK